MRLLKIIKLFVQCKYFKIRLLKNNNISNDKAEVISNLLKSNRNIKINNIIEKKDNKEYDKLLIDYNYIKTELEEYKNKKPEIIKPYYFIIKEYQLKKQHNINH